MCQSSEDISLRRAMACRWLGAKHFINLIMHFDVFICNLWNYHSLYIANLCLLVPIVQCNVKSIFAFVPETDTQVYLIEREFTYFSRQVLQRTILKSLWTNPFVPETSSWCQATWAPLIKRYRAYVWRVYVYRYIDKMRGYQIKF